MIRATAFLALLAATASAADLTGHVAGADDKPLRNAHVYVYTARPKQGVSTVCPSCYRDCGKHEAVAASGDFRIAAVDPSLKYELLAVADGYDPSFTPYTSPDERVAITLNPRNVADEATLVRGRVVDHDGKAVVGARVEPQAVRLERGTGYGRIPGVDPLSITNAEGEFALRIPAAAKWLDVRVRARNAGPKIERAVAPLHPRTITVDAGAGISGHLVRDGKPVAGVVLTIAPPPGPSGDYVGDERIATDDHGRFLMTGLASNSKYRIILPPATSLKTVDLGGAGSVTDAGTIELK
jgi:hypothetical protein